MKRSIRTAWPPPCRVKAPWPKGSTFEGRVTYQAVAEALGLDYVPVEEALTA